MYSESLDLHATGSLPQCLSLGSLDRYSLCGVDVNVWPWCLFWLRKADCLSHCRSWPRVWRSVGSPLAIPPTTLRCRQPPRRQRNQSREKVLSTARRSSLFIQEKTLFRMKALSGLKRRSGSLPGYDCWELPTETSRKILRKYGPGPGVHLGVRTTGDHGGYKGPPWTTREADDGNGAGVLVPAEVRYCYYL